MSLLLILFRSNTEAIDITDIVLTGNTVDIKIEDILKNRSNELSKEDIESIGVRITNEYHRRGYTTSYVEKFSIKKNGSLEIHVFESRILGLNVTGISDKENADIEKSMSYLKGVIYNRFRLERSIEPIKKKYNLNAVTIYPINYKDSGDVFLSVNVKRNRRGDFYGGVGIDLIYGISPQIGYLHPFHDSSINLFSRIGYRDHSFRRIEGDVKYFTFADNKISGLHVGINSSRLLEVWESYNTEFEVISISPIIGYRFLYRNILFDIYYKQITTLLKHYKQNNFTDYDNRITLDINTIGSDSLLIRRDSTDLGFSISCGKSELEKHGYIITSSKLQSTVTPFVFLRFIPRINIYYTTSNERLFWRNVYNKDLLGFFDDFTASKWKNIVGLDAEIEISPNFFYIGPFINIGRFLDESDTWNTKTGGGLKTEIIHRKLSVEIYYAWDLSIGLTEGGLFFLIGGRF